MIYIGQYFHALDKKNRVFLPAKFRKTSGNFIVTNGVDGCLYLYPENEWKVIVQKFDGISLKNKEEERAFKRAFLSEALEVSTDNLGRMLLPAKMLKDIGANRNVVIVGVWKRLEIWPQHKWKKYMLRAKRSLKKVSRKFEI